MSTFGYVRVTAVERWLGESNLQSPSRCTTVQIKSVCGLRKVKAQRTTKEVQVVVLIEQ